MKYYKNSQNEVYAYDDDVGEEQIAEGLTKITEAQAKSMLEPSLEELKAAKTAELASWVNAMGESCKVEIKDFGAVNGGYKYLLNIEAMIDTFDSLEVRAFRMHDNSMKKINGQEDLKKIKRAIQIAGQKLHVLKWGHELKIEKAKNKKELDAIIFTDTIEVAL
ncbi:hypothetical protein [uncultured Campylobacter sp.]|uniref:hypothetical protein n=1 Tax=uncultured Campylobacter sp. TaxID=218934 RepID=UPI00263247B7|nr:hypothetical protein [uncultured Campylobacter sp.]